MLSRAVRARRLLDWVQTRCTNRPHQQGVSSCAQVPEEGWPSPTPLEHGRSRSLQTISFARSFGPGRRCIRCCVQFHWARTLDDPQGSPLAQVRGYSPHDQQEQEEQHLSLSHVEDYLPRRTERIKSAYFAICRREIDRIIRTNRLLTFSTRCNIP